MRRLPIAVIATLAIGLVLGYVLGGISPRRELEESRREVVVLERALAEGGNDSRLRSPVPGLDEILRAPERREPPTEGVSGASEDWRESADDGRDGTRNRPDAGADRGEDEEDPLEAFRRAASVQRVRIVQSRAALVEQAGLEEEEIAEVDTALAEMNDALVGYGEELLLMAIDGERPPPRELLGITHDVTGILHRAQLRLEEVVGPDRTSRVDPSALEVWNHVDLERLEPAAEAAVDRLR